MSLKHNRLYRVIEDTPYFAKGDIIELVEDDGDGIPKMRLNGTEISGAYIEEDNFEPYGFVEGKEPANVRFELDKSVTTIVIQRRLTMDEVGAILKIVEGA